MFSVKKYFISFFNILRQTTSPIFMRDRCDLGTTQVVTLRVRLVPDLLREAGFQCRVVKIHYGGLWFSSRTIEIHPDF